MLLISLYNIINTYAPDRVLQNNMSWVGRCTLLYSTILRVYSTSLHLLYRYCIVTLYRIPMITWHWILNKDLKRWIIKLRRQLVSIDFDAFRFDTYSLLIHKEFIKPTVETYWGLLTNCQEGWPFSRQKFPFYATRLCFLIRCWTCTIMFLKILCLTFCEFVPVRT